MKTRKIEITEDQAAVIEELLREFLGKNYHTYQDQHYISKQVAVRPIYNELLRRV